MIKSQIKIYLLTSDKYKFLNNKNNAREVQTLKLCKKAISFVIKKFKVEKKNKNLFKLYKLKIKMLANKTKNIKS